jgi:tetratricopeptide (TPR) repeat protein/tRNA A-37 threonylcarbamoyl transferase component Bud32
MTAGAGDDRTEGTPTSGTMSIHRVIVADADPGGGGGADVVLDALAEWDESYRRGEDRPIESFGLSDPAKLSELHTRIERQRRLYLVLKLAETIPQPAAQAAPPLPTFPGYETESTIGRGGMGQVYKARDLKLNRVVAIKTIAWADHATRGQIERFLAEAEAIARLEHANVIPIYAISEADGRPYYTLEYAAGGSLANRLAQGPMAAAQAALLLETVALAAHAAHSAGIVHRDLKPSNVLLTAEGIPKISDFGVAKLLDHTAVRTLSGEALGTPSYMAPEQAEGRSKDVGPAADVYALGAILYQTLTGKPPFLGESAIETLKLVASAEVVPPRRLRPEVPIDLETICLVCLEKSPEKRYRTALDLALDLKRFRSGEPIRARRISRARKLAKWARRHPWQTALAATTSAAILAVGLLTYRHNAQLRLENQRTEAKAAEARRNYLEARSTIQAMLDHLNDGRVAGSPGLIDLRRDQGNDALAFYDQILAHLDASDSVVLADTIRALVEAATMQYVLGQLGRAEQTARRALGLIAVLRSKSSDELECLRLEVDCLMKLGACIEIPARREEAAAVYERLIPLAERLARAENDSPHSADLRAACHNSYASILGLDRFELAKAQYRKAIELRERKDVLAIPRMNCRLAQSVVNLGVIHWKEHDYPQAEARFLQAEDVLLVSKNPNGALDREAVITLGQIAVNWVGLLWELKRNEKAVARANTALERLESYVRLEPNDEVASELCLKLHGNRGQAFDALGKYREAADDWAKVVALAREPVPAFYRIALALELLKAGELDRALAQARLLDQSASLSGVDLYNVSCFHCRAADFLQASQSGAAEDRSRRRKQFLASALAALRKAALAGFFRDPAMQEQARSDPDLKSLRDAPEFERLIAAAPG